MGMFGWNFIFALLVIYPVWRIYERTGLNPLFALLVFVPGIGWLLALLPLAFMDWPNRLRASESRTRE